MKNVLIKNVPEDAWKEFRTEAISHDLTAGEFFSFIIEEHKKNHQRKHISSILNFRLNLSKSDFEDFEKATKQLRKNSKLER